MSRLAFLGRAENLLLLLLPLLTYGSGHDGTRVATENSVDRAPGVLE